jgi:peptide deformylase
MTPPTAYLRHTCFGDIFTTFNILQGDIMIYPIRYYGDPVLKKKAARVTTFDDALAQLAQDMLETMYDANGVGLAGPQIGISKRIFVALELGESEDEEDAEPETREDKKHRWNVINEHVMVNPKVITASGEQFAQDGCLSLPGLFVEDMKRHLDVQVRYQDVRGEQHEITATGHFAHVIQHENDHLNGVLFFERLPSAEQRTFKETHRQELIEMQRQAKAFLRELKDQAKKDPNRKDHTKDAARM